MKTGIESTLNLFGTIRTFKPKQYATVKDSLRNHFLEASQVLERVLSDKKFFERVESAGRLMVQALAGSGKILSCGNGGSMCDAMHFAEELTGRYRENRRAIAAASISDPSHISCVANDYGYEFIFSRYIEAWGKPGDVLLAISTSGNSPNVVRAAETALNTGMKVVALTGNEGGRLAKLANVEIRVPFTGYADRIQEVHIKVIHAIIDYIEREIS